MFVIVVDPHSTNPGYVTRDGSRTHLPKSAATFATDQAARRFARKLAGRLRSYAIKAAA